MEPGTLDTVFAPQGKSDAMSVTLQPDTKEGVAVPVPNYPIDPTTGLAVDVIKTGDCPERSLGDMALQPNPLGETKVPDNKNGVGE